MIVNGRDLKTVRVAAGHLREGGIDASESIFDVSDSNQIADAVSEIVQKIGPPDILVNNAGIQHRGPLETFTDADWSRLMSVNLDGVFKVSRAVASHMIERQAGSIINIASVQSELARPSIAPYAASKGAIKMLTKSMAGEWGKYGIRVNAIGPGYFRTELNEALVADLVFSEWIERRTPLWPLGRAGRTGGSRGFPGIAGGELPDRANHLCRWRNYQRLVTIPDRLASGRTEAGITCLTLPILEEKQ